MFRTSIPSLFTAFLIGLTACSDNTPHPVITAPSEDPARGLIETLGPQQTFAMLGWQANPAYEPMEHCFDHWSETAVATAIEIEDCDGHAADLSRLYASYGVEVAPTVFKSTYYWDQRDAYLAGWEDRVKVWKDAGGTEDDASYLKHPNCAEALQTGWTGSGYFYDGRESPICRFYKIEAIEKAQD